MSNWKPVQHIRATAQAIIQRERQILVYEGFDAHKKENFYRPIGGTVEFLEPARDTVVREFKEEAGIDIHSPILLGVIENIYVFNGHHGHEVVQVFKCQFKDSSFYSQEQFPLIEGSDQLSNGVWKDIDFLLHSETRFFPKGMKDLVTKFCQ
jgi:ADP-ribose pyrophosphatase YjhB (NUDIX family)